MSQPALDLAHTHDFQADIDLIASIDAVPTILDVVCRTTGMGFAAVARVTESRWVACRVRDDIAFGLEPGGELQVESTICHEIRETRTPVVINHVAEDELYCGHPTPARYSFQSYISMPILLPDGTFFGTLCAIDPKPAQLNTPEVVGSFKMFAELIGFQIDAHLRTASAKDAMRSEAFVRGILSASPDCVKVLSRDGRLEFMNPRGVEMNQLGSLSDVIGQEFASSWPESERHKIQDAVQRAAAGEIARTEGFCPTAKGEPRWWEVSFSPFRPEGAADLKIVGISRDVTERVLARERLAENEQRQDALVRSSSDVRYYINADWSELHQLSGGDFIPDTASANANWLAEYIPSEDQDAVRAEIGRAVGTTSTYQIEHRVNQVDGTVGWASSRAVPLFAPTGEVTGWIGSASDITARKQAEAALLEMNATLERKVLERTAERDRTWVLSKELLVVSRADGTFEAVNARWTELLGWSETELIGTKYTEYTHPDDMEATLATFVDIFERPLVTPYESRFRHKDGSYWWFAWTGSFADGRVYASGRDVTAEKMQAERLRQIQARAAAYFNFSEDYLFLLRIDADGIARFEDMNPACERVMGVLRANVIGRPVETVVPPDSSRDISHYAGLCLETQQPQTYDAPRNYQGGRTILIEGRVTLVERVSDREGLLLFSGHDVTERRGMEEALRQSQKMEAVGQLTGGLAHDFNNLLAGISGSLEMMQNRMQQGRLDDVERYMAVAQGASKRAAALTHRLLAFSRRQTLDPKPTDVNRLVAGMQEMIQRTVGPGIPVEVVGASGLWPALVDPPQLENALLNLCINARDAMPDGGRITVETANKWFDERAAKKQDIPEGQYLSLCVTDTGTGMSPDVIARVFEPFFTTKPIGEGTGLGLSMIYGFAQQSGGQVRIYSEVGEGSTICIYLPRHYGEVAIDDPTDKLAFLPPSEQGETVLVVDDEPSVRMLVTDILEDLGYTAIEASDSAAGLKVLQSNVRIDLLVTDVGLPGGMNGRQMADAARVSRPELKVLFVTGYAENALLANGHLALGMAVLTKPFPVETMAARIRSMIQAKH